jgi:MSHA biogenesis protein MshJ
MSTKPDLASTYGKLAAKLEDMTLRERGIIVGALVVVVVFLWLQFVFDPMERQQKRSRDLVQESETKILALSEEQTMLIEKINQDPNIVLRRQQTQLVAQIEQQRLLLEEKLQGLVAPSKMVDVLKSVLHATAGLKLVRAGNLPVQKFSSAPEPAVSGAVAGTLAGTLAKDAPKDTEALPLYVHGLELVIEGDFYTIVDFLRRLEGLEQGFQWSMMDYLVTTYPQARVRVQVQTLSLDEQWIGV